jgi:hypothetical protein
MAGILFTAVLMLAPAARAETVALTCVGAEATKFTPGLTLNTRQTFVDALGVAGCTGVPLGILSAIISTQGQGPQSCLAGNAPVEIDIQWSDDTTSHARGTFAVNLKPLGETVIILTAKIESGRFCGATVVRTLTLLNTNFLGCLTPQGVTNVAGPVTLTVTGL